MRINSFKNGLVLIGLIFMLTIFGCKNKTAEKNSDDKNENKVAEDSNANSKQADYLSDFEFAFDTLKTYYPFFDVNKKLNDIDFLSMHDEFKSWISECKNDDEFFDTMDEILSYVNNGHTNMVPIEEGNFFHTIYFDSTFNPELKRISETYEKPLVKERYKIVSDYKLENDAHEGSGEKETSNVIAKDYVDGRIAYIKVKEMRIKRDKDIEVLNKYLDKIKNYDALIIDIQGNPGGDSTYWQDYLIPKITNRPLTQNVYSFMKKGKIFEDIFELYGYEDVTEDVMEELDFPEVTSEIAKKFDKYSFEAITVEPSEKSINFGGNIYLLVDRDVFSSAEALASFAKETGFATLVGEKTGGDGIGTDPYQVDLPKTGYVMRFPKELGITERGVIDELEKTTPDIKIISNEENINEDSKKKVLEIEDENAEKDMNKAS